MATYFERWLIRLALAILLSTVAVAPAVVVYEFGAALLTPSIDATLGVVFAAQVGTILVGLNFALFAVLLYAVPAYLLLRYFSFVRYWVCLIIALAPFLVLRIYWNEWSGMYLLDWCAAVIATVFWAVVRNAGPTTDHEPNYALERPR